MRDKSSPVVGELTAATRELRAAVHEVGNLVRARVPERERPDLAPPPRRAGGLRVVLGRLPALAAEFEQKIPASHVGADCAQVRCCSGVVPLVVGVIEACPGGCGRYFLRTEVDVRVARWEPCELEDRYSGPGWTPVAA